MSYISCNCGNNGYVVAQYDSILSAKRSLFVAKHRLFNPKWQDIVNDPINHPTNKNLESIQSHLKQGHKIKIEVYLK